MKKIELSAPGRLSLVNEEHELSLMSGMVKVRVNACGICGSDLALLNGKRDLTQERYFGHEFSGVVTEVADDRRVNSPEHAADAGTAGTDCRNTAGV